MYSSNTKPPQTQEKKQNIKRKINKAFLFFSLLTFSFTFSQNKTTSKCTTEVNCSEKNGTTITEREYTLTVIYDNKEIKFSTYNNPSEKGMNKFIITKKTEKYIISKNSEDNYSFFNIKSKQFYYIDFFMNRYLTSGYGSNSKEIKENTEKMIEILKNGKTQKDVIQYLIDQSKYDF